MNETTVEGWFMGRFSGIDMNNFFIEINIIELILGIVKLKISSFFYFGIGRFTEPTLKKVTQI